MAKSRTHWASRLSFVMVSAGAAIGLGNIWRFPYITGMNGGGAFVLIYIAFVILLGIPLMASEVLIGRKGQQNTVYAFRDISKLSHKTSWWSLAGYVPLIAGFLILTYYAVITGWVLEYIWQAATGALRGITTTNADQHFSQLLKNPLRLIFWDTIIIWGVAWVIAKGIHRGLEKTTYIMLPTMMILIFTLILYAINAGSFWQGFEYLFYPDFQNITIHGILLALGQAFFSLGIGSGVMLTYGTYVDRQTSIIKTSVAICMMDTLVSILAGLMIFPIVFSNNLPVDAGPSLIFKTIPVAFGHLPMGQFFCMLFFIMLALAAFTSAFSLLEPTVTYLIENRQWTRKKSAFIGGAVAWFISLACILSFNIGSKITLLGTTFFDFLDHLTSNIMLPVSGLLVSLFTGWVMYKRDTADELQIYRHGKLYRNWRFCVRFIAPLCILIIFAKSLELF